MPTLGIEMTIEQLGSLGEILAAAATIATLAYLALQIRRNTQATRAASFHAITDSMNHINVSVAQTPGLARIWLAGTADRNALSEEERHQYDLLLLAYFHVFETLHYQSRVGAGETSLVAAEARSLGALLATRGVRDWWAENPYAFAAEFRAYVDQFIANRAENEF
jgi:hypothetical protein